MDVGQVGFHDEKLRRFTKVARKNNDIMNRLEKTKLERQPDLKAEKEVSSLSGFYPKKSKGLSMFLSCFASSAIVVCVTFFCRHESTTCFVLGSRRSTADTILPG